MGAKLKALFLLVVMFALGSVSGVAWEMYHIQHALPRTPYASSHVAQLKRELQLTDDQEQALNDIFDRAHERAKEINEEVAWDLADIHEDSLKSIHKVLTPEQNVKFEVIHQRTAHHPASDKTADAPPAALSGNVGDATS